MGYLSADAALEMLVRWQAYQRGGARLVAWRPAGTSLTGLSQAAHEPGTNVAAGSSYHGYR
ncbi:MAG: hypothetical protein JO345_41995 [Streptosporangiaceae bacterium]|nr:hypothetical protein [Streptosporangiaceae bacterium]